MPMVKILLWGNLPAELDVTMYGEPMGVSVEHRTGVKWLDMDQAELDRITSDNNEAVMEAILDHKREHIDYSKMLMEDLRRG